MRQALRDFLQRDLDFNINLEVKRFEKIMRGKRL